MSDREFNACTPPPLPPERAAAPPHSDWLTLHRGVIADDLSLPKATVQKIISEILPPDLAFAKEARDLLIDCCVEFITLISSEANDIAEREAKKTIAAEHVIRALKDLGFEEYIDEIQEVAMEHKEHQKVGGRPVRSGGILCPRRREGA